MPTIVFGALAFGYGPAAKAIAIARSLRPRLRTVFAGRDAALDLVRRAPDAFDEVLDASADAARVADEGSRAAAAVSVMDRELGRLAARDGIPLFAVDSLLWMRAAVPPELADARRLFAQRFPGLEDGAYDPAPTLVGPIVSAGSRAARPTSTRRRGVVVNLGGARAPQGREALYAGYARFVARAVDAAGLARRLGPVRFLGGAAPGLAPFRAAGPDEARAAMSQAAAVVTAPGLTATLECFADATPTWFLPPQNYAQWCALRRLRAVGVADGAFHWEDVDDRPPLGERLEPEARDPRVVESVLRLVDDRRALDALAASLDDVGRRSPARVDAQRAFFASLGPDGVETIASALRAHAETEPREPVASTPNSLRSTRGLPS